MSDMIDDVDVLGHQLLNKSGTISLRNRLQEFVDETPGAGNLKELRREVAEGRDLSDLVAQEREERL